MLYNLNNNRVNDYDPAVVPATPEEIKAAHGKCGTCKHITPVKFLDENGIGVDYECNHYAHSNRDPIAMNLNTDYCNHHEPKET